MISKSRVLKNILFAVLMIFLIFLHLCCFKGGDDVDMAVMSDQDSTSDIVSPDNRFYIKRIFAGFVGEVTFMLFSCWRGEINVVCF